MPVALLAGVLLALLTAGSAAAHGGNGLNVDPPVAEPGQQVTVYGSYLWSDQPVTVVLLAIDGTQWELGTGTTDGNGGLWVDVVIPSGLPDATYSVLARADNGEDAHARLDLKSPFPLVPVALAAAAVAAVILFVIAVVLLRRRRITVDV